MKRLSTKIPWWVGERMDCDKCGDSWEMEQSDAFEQIDGDFADAYRTPAERKAIAEGTGEPEAVMYVTVIRDMLGHTAARFICRSCGWSVMVNRDEITVPRRLADQTPEEAPLNETDVAALEALKKQRKADDYFGPG